MCELNANMSVRTLFLFLGLSCLSAVGCTKRDTSQIPSRDSRGVLGFEDVSLKSGITFKHQNSNTTNKYLIETMGSGGAAVDLNNDGWTDLVFVNNRTLPGGASVTAPSVAVYQNQHGAFIDRTPHSGLEQTKIYGMGISAADFDKDGLIDLYVTSVLDGSRLFKNLGGFRFKDVTAKAGVGNKGSWGTSSTWVDMDKDGDLDLFVCNYVNYATLADDQPCFSGDENKRIYCIPSAYDGSMCRLYKNNDNGTFTDVSVAAGLSVSKGKSLGLAVWDVDRDGYEDIFVANDTTPGFLFMNNRNGTFKEVGVEAGVAYNESGIPHSGMGIDAQDLDHNGSTSLLITNYFGQETNLYHQVGDVLFQDERLQRGVAGPTNHYVGFGVGFVDLDNDGALDVFQTNGHVQDEIQEREPNASFKQQPVILRNMGRGLFTEVTADGITLLKEKRVGRGVVLVDFDNDGKQDVVLTNNNDSVKVWKNTTAKVGHFIGISLASKQTTDTVIGTEITLVDGDRKQRFLVRTGSGYLTQNDMRIHIGLGNKATAVLQLKWPNGTQEVFSVSKVDAYVTLKQGTGTRVSGH